MKVIEVDFKNKKKLGSYEGAVDFEKYDKLMELFKQSSHIIKDLCSENAEARHHLLGAMIEIAQIVGRQVNERN